MKFSTSFVALAVAFASLSAAFPTTTLTSLSLAARGDGFVTAPCKQDSDCQQGCCAFNTGKCAGPAVAQTRDGGCGFGSGAPNCNVAAALKLSDCAPGAKNGDLGDPAIQAAAKFVSQLDGIPFTPTAPGANNAGKGGAAGSAPPPPPASNSKPPGNAQGFVTSACTQDSDCQQGCCARNTGKCAGPGIAQTRDGGCGFGDAAPNCNVATLLKLNQCAAGAVQGNLNDPVIIAAAKFTANLDGIPFTPPAAGANNAGSGGAAGSAPAPASNAKPPGNAQGFVTSACTQDSDCQQGCCARNTGKCAGPGIAQTRDGGCGFGDAAPNCNVATLLKLNQCAAGAVQGNLQDPVIIAAARFTANLDGIPFSG